MPLLIVLTGLAALACHHHARRLSRAGTAPLASDLGARANPGPVVEWWARALADAGVEVDPRTSGRAALGGVALLALAGAARGGPTGAIVVVTVVLAGAIVARQALRGRGAQAADARLPELVEHVGRGLRAGHDLRGAVLVAADVVGGPHGRALGAAVGRIDGGAGWADALEGWHHAHPRRPVQLVVGALVVAEEAGGRAGPALDGVAATLRARAAVADEARALAGQARASAAVLVGLPVVVAVGGAAADRRVAATLLGTPWGLGCIALAVVLDGAGALWMQRIVSGARP